MLRTAQRLAERGAGPGRPPLCDLRRATSTAYYALFHQLTRHGAAAAGPGAPDEDVAQVVRWFTHQGVRAAADAARPVAEAAGSPRAGPAAALLRSATRGADPGGAPADRRVFADLQDARHRADYDNGYQPVRFLTLDHVVDAEQAVRAAQSLWRAGESSRPERREAHDAYRRFLLPALLSSGGPKTRR